ncbi:MAG: hypothetical protein ABL867_11370 [Rickettsiales bacterium]
MAEPIITTGIPQIPSKQILTSLTKAAYFEKQADEKKELLLRSLNPQALKELITQIKANNTDGNKRDLSYEETEGLVGDKMAAIRKAVQGDEKLRSELKEAASPCAHLNSSLYSEHAGNKLTGMSESMTFNVELLQTMAKTINNCGGEFGGDYDKEIEAMRVRLADKWKKPFLSMPQLSSETREIINKKFDKASEEVISKIKTVFHTDPHIVTEFMNLPKVSEQKMSPDEVCQHLPPNNPPPKGQSKIAFK